MTAPYAVLFGWKASVKNRQCYTGTRAKNPTVLNNFLKMYKIVTVKLLRRPSTIMQNTLGFILNAELIRWLYCVEFPQYSIRLEALDYLCDCLSGRVQLKDDKWSKADGSIVFARWQRCVLPWLHIGATWRMRLNVCILRPIGFHNQKRQIDQFSRFCPAHCRKCLYLTIGHHIHQNCLPRGIWTPSNTWFVGAMRAHNPNDTSIGSAVFAQMIADCPLYNGFARFPLKITPFPWRLDAHVIHGSFAHPSPQPKRHLDRFSRFCKAH